MTLPVGLKHGLVAVKAASNTEAKINVNQGCELDRFLTEFKFEFKKYLQVRVPVRVLRILFFVFKFQLTAQMAEWYRASVS